jgi:threonine/homoserine/homoserine lactone efflux protein
MSTEPPPPPGGDPHGEAGPAGHRDVHLADRSSPVSGEQEPEELPSWQARVRGDLAGALWSRPIRDNDAVRNQARGNATIGRVTGVTGESVLGVGLIIFGVLLGVADQASATTPGDLRVPALLAALFLAGQGLTFVVQGLRKEKAERMERRIAESISERTGGESQVVGESEPGTLVIATATPTARTVIQQAKLVSHAVPQRATSGVALLLMALAIWLGLETLRVTAPPALSGLSLLGAFLLFAFGWKTLVDPEP